MRLDSQTYDKLQGMVFQRLGNANVRNVRISIGNDYLDDEVLKIEVDLVSQRVDRKVAERFSVLTRQIREYLSESDLNLFPIITPKYVEGPDDAAA